MYDFILNFVASGAGWLLCAESILAGQAPPVAFSVVRFVGSKTVEQGASRDLVSSLATLPRSSSPSWQCDSWQAAQLGGELYREVFREGVQELFHRALDEARERRAGLRLLIKARQLQEIHEVPWELLHDGRRFLAQRLETPIVRYIEQPQPVRRLQVGSPLRILFTAACPPGEVPLDLAAEERFIRAALVPLSNRVDLTVHQHISWERLRFCLLRAESEQRPYHVWHHGGHGGLGEAMGHRDFSLALQDDSGARQAVSVAQLGPMLAGCPGLRIAVLNVCHSGSSAGLATMLANLNVPSVVGFRASIFDRSALVFAETFYSSLIERPVEDAVTLARVELQHAGNGPLDWAQPLLFARTPTVQPLLATRDTRDR
jgi:hypothetical protein